MLQQVQNINSQILWLVWAFGCNVLVSTVSHCTKSTYHNSFHLSHRYSHLIHHTPCSETHTACCCRWTLTPGMPDMLTAHGHRNIPLVSDGLLPLRHFRYSKSALTTLFSVVNPQQTNKQTNSWKVIITVNDNWHKVNKDPKQKLTKLKQFTVAHKPGFCCCWTCFVVVCFLLQFVLTVSY